MVFKSRNLTPRIGAEILSDRETLLSGSHAKQVRELLEARGVLVFPRIGFSDEEQVAFTRTLGELLQFDKEIYKISVDEKESRFADLNRAAICWHFDGSTDDVPSLGSALSPRRLSQTGGETEFANTYAAYEDLPEADKAAIEGLRVVHMQETIQRNLFPEPTEEQLKRWHSWEPKTQPLVWTHRSGRKSLVLGATSTRIVGMEPEASRSLIDRLQAWITQPQYIYRHHWSMGDLVMWDNTGVQHRVEPYPLDSGRLMHRTTLKGEEALSA